MVDIYLVTFLLLSDIMEISIGEKEKKQEKRKKEKKSLITWLSVTYILPNQKWYIFSDISVT